MQFNNTTLKNGIIQRCELYTGLGDTAISGNATLLAQFTSLINSAYEKVITSVLSAMDGWDFDDSNYDNFPIATTPMVASQRQYSFPSNILKIKRVDFSYDGTNYYRAEAFDIGEYGEGVGNDTNVDANFSKDKPKYDFKYGGIFIYPLASATDITNGAEIRVEYTRDVDVFTVSDTTQQPGIDRPFHQLIPKYASLEWGMSKGLKNKNDLAVLVQDDELRLKKFYGSKQLDRNIILKASYIDYE